MIENIMAVSKFITHRDHSEIYYDTEVMECEEYSDMQATGIAAMFLLIRCRSLNTEDMILPE